MDMTALTSSLMDWVSANSQWLLMSILVLLTIGLIIFIRITIHLNKLMKIYQALMRGEKHLNLEELLLENSRMVQESYRRLDAIDKTLANQEVFNRETLRNVGMIRFNAFQGVGSDQSFSVAILDNNSNGVVISSLYGRELSQVYGKPVKNGQSNYPLSEEEIEAISMAMHKK